MANLRIYPNSLFGRNRNEPEAWYGYVSSNAGNVSSATKLELTEIDRHGPTNNAAISFNATTDQLTLSKNNAFRITARVQQVGASSTFELYQDGTPSATSLFTTAAGAGDKFIDYYVANTVSDVKIIFRVNNQTSNTNAQTNSFVEVVRLGKIDV